MSTSTYNALTFALLGSSILALLLGVAYLVAAIVGWRGPHRKKRFVRFAICFGTFPVLVAAQQAVLFGLFLPSLGGQAERQRQDRADAASLVHVGNPAPSFTLTDTDGAEFVLDTLRGKVVLVNFFATWCGPCLQELPHVQKVWDENRNQGDFALIVIGREETDESVAEFRSRHGYTFPMASDPQRSVYSLYAEELIPRTYLVSPDGKICFASTGFREQDLAGLERELAQQRRSTR